MTAISFNDWEKNTSKYVIYLAFVALAFIYSKSLFDGNERVKDLKAQIVYERGEKDKYRIELQKANANIDSAQKVIGYLSGIKLFEKK